jgi:hypothetical protein
VLGTEIADRQRSVQLVEFAVDATDPLVGEIYVGIEGAADVGRESLHNDLMLASPRVDRSQLYSHG